MFACRWLFCCCCRFLLIYSLPSLVYIFEYFYCYCTTTAELPRNIEFGSAAAKPVAQISNNSRGNNDEVLRAINDLRTSILASDNSLATRVIHDNMKNIHVEIEKLQNLCKTMSGVQDQVSMLNPDAMNKIHQEINDIRVGLASEFDNIKHKFDNIDARLDALESSVPDQDHDQDQSQDHDDTTD